MGDTKATRTARLLRLHNKLVEEVEKLRLGMNRLPYEMAEFLSWDTATYSRFSRKNRDISDGMLGAIALNFPTLLDLAARYRKCRLVVEASKPKRVAPEPTNVTLL